MVCLTPNQRNAAERMLLRGSTHSVIARNFLLSRSTIFRLNQLLRETGTANDRPRSGCPRVTSRRQDRFIRFTHLRNRFRIAVETAKTTPRTHNNRISSATVKNCLPEFGLRSRRPYVDVPLNTSSTSG